MYHQVTTFPDAGVLEPRRRTVAMRWHAGARGSFYGSGRHIVTLTPEWDTDDTAAIVAQIRRYGGIEPIEVVPGRSDDSLKHFFQRHELAFRPADQIDVGRSNRPTRAAVAQAEWEEARRRRQDEQNRISSIQWAQEEERRQKEKRRLQAIEAERQAELVEAKRQAAEEKAQKERARLHQLFAQRQVEERQKLYELDRQREVALLQAEREQSLGRDYSVVGGETKWHKRAKAWVLAQPEEKRLQQLLAAQRHTHHLARELWDELRVELEL